jgi:Tfp pilus assembly protein PilF
MRNRFPQSTLAVCVYSVALLATTGCSLTPSMPKWQWPWVARRQELDRALSLARLTERQGNLDEAMITYRKILEADPDNVLAHHRVGAVAVKERRFDDARTSFETAMKLAEPNAELLNDVGYLHYLRQDLPGAEAMFRQSLTKDPRNKHARNNLGLALAEQGRFDEALAEFRQVGTEAEAYSNLAYIQVKVGELAEAEKNCHKALSLDNSLRPAAEALMQVADLKAKATGTVPPSMISKVYSDPPAQRPAEGLGAGNPLVESVRPSDQAATSSGRNARRSLSSASSELQPATYTEPEPGQSGKPLGTQTGNVRPGPRSGTTNTAAVSQTGNPANNPPRPSVFNDSLRPAGPTPVAPSPVAPSPVAPPSANTSSSTSSPVSASPPLGPTFQPPRFNPPSYVPPVPNGSSTTERLPDVPTAGAASNTSPFR